MFAGQQQLAALATGINHVQTAVIRDSSLRLACFDTACQVHSRAAVAVVGMC